MTPKLLLLLLLLLWSLLTRCGFLDMGLIGICDADPCPQGLLLAVTSGKTSTGVMLSSMVVIQVAGVGSLSQALVLQPQDNPPGLVVSMP